MKAYLVNQYRTPMQVGAAAEPTVGDREVLVDIHTAGVSHLDARIRDWDFKLFLPYKTPSILRHDLAGVVTRIGPVVTRFTAGDQVYGRPRDHRIGINADIPEETLSVNAAFGLLARITDVPLYGDGVDPADRAPEAPADSEAMPA